MQLDPFYVDIFPTFHFFDKDLLDFRIMLFVGRIFRHMQSFQTIGVQLFVSRPSQNTAVMQFV